MGIRKKKNETGAKLTLFSPFFVGYIIFVVFVVFVFFCLDVAWRPLGACRRYLMDLASPVKPVYGLSC